MSFDAFKSGEFMLGCNYWASNAGTNMWHDWDESVVDDDFKRLSEHNIKVLRVFPRWSDFQPIEQLYGYIGRNEQIRINEKTLGFDKEGRAGIDPVMVERFEKMCALAEKYNLKLVVGLITGWMSARLYVPRALEGRNVITDPLALRWEARYIEYMVERLKKQKSIIAWDLGNECNCMGEATKDEAYAWSKYITLAIKSKDNTRPVVSGMHSLDPNGDWTPEDQGEITDILTTHPYPMFTPHCNTDPMTTFKSAFHATAESLMYSGLGGVPCIVEEAGVLGPMNVSDEKAADYASASVLTSWAHDLRAFLWWCANEQTNLKHAPYDWQAVERELGLFYADKTPKPVLNAFSKIQKYIDSLPFKTLPPRICDAVCILTKDSDAWASAYGTFLIAKQAGLDVEFAYSMDEIPKSDVYLIPSLEGGTGIYRTAFDGILERVREGATLYISNKELILDGFCELTGLEPDVRYRREHSKNVVLNGEEIKVDSDVVYDFNVKDAEVIAYTDDGKPAMSVKPCGKGKVYFLNYPIEYIAATKPGITYGELHRPYDKFYRAMPIRSKKKCAMSDTKTVCVTEHILDDNSRALVIINYEPCEKTAKISLDGYSFDKIIALDENTVATPTDFGFDITIKNNCGAVVIIKK